MILDPGNLLDSRGNVYRIWTYRVDRGPYRVRREATGQKQRVTTQPFPGSAGKSEIESGAAAAECAGHPRFNEYRCARGFQRIEPGEIRNSGKVGHHQGNQPGTLESCDQFGRSTPMQLGARQSDPIPYG